MGADHRTDDDQVASQTQHMDHITDVQDDQTKGKLCIDEEVNNDVV